MDGAAYFHVPALEREVLSWLMPALSSGGVVVDATVGGGGHAQSLLAAVSGVKLLGIDRDGDAIEAARGRLAGYFGRVTLIQGRFSELERVVRSRTDGRVEAVLYDLGVSSPQLDLADRGFGFRSDGPLDMRMDRTDDLSAQKVVNTYSESRLADIIARYGEEKFARRIAHAIVAKRPISTTSELREVVRSAIPAAARRRGPHPARRTFQALRIEVNRELEELEASLPQAIEVLDPGGRMAVIAYHSLEDRIVKRALRDAARGCRCPVDLPVCVCGRNADVRVLTKKPVRPSRAEVESNPRADSARLRVAMRLAPPEEGG